MNRQFANFHRPYRRHRRLNPTIMPVVVALLVGGVGVYLSSYSSAAESSNLTVTAEAETGTVKAPALAINNSKATVSAGGVVYFGSSISTEAETAAITGSIDDGTVTASGTSGSFYEKFCSGQVKVEKAGAISDNRLKEISGAAGSRRVAGTIWVHNDSSGAAEIYAINSSGKTTATYKVEGAENIDWEDIDIASDGNVYVADTGTNKKDRSSVDVYKFPEPDPAKSGTVKATKISLTYEDGQSHDAEAMFVDGKGIIYLVDKSNRLASHLWKASGASGAIILDKVSEIAYKSGKKFEEVTGADISPDGKLITIRTYDNMYLYKVSGGDKACRYRYGGGSRSEAITFNAKSNGLISLSEGNKQRIYSITEASDNASTTTKN